LESTTTLGTATVAADARLIQQLRAFDGVPGLKAQVDTWLSS